MIDKILLTVSCLIYFCSSQAKAGAPFYLTVERSFSNKERPSVVVDFADGKQPMAIRVLKPASLDELLQGQIQISRSYEEPRVAVNPARYLIKGLNAISSPLRVLRSMFTESYRKKERVFASSLKPNYSDAVLTPPSITVVKEPAGYTKVREYFIDLNRGGEDLVNKTPGFEDYAWMGSRYERRNIDLDPLPPGVYLLQAVQGSTEAQALLQVSDFTVQVKQTSRQLLLSAVSREGMPVEGVEYSYRDAKGKWTKLVGKSNSTGMFLAKLDSASLDRQLVVKANHKGSEVLTQTDFLPAIVDDQSIFILTDRPIFRPGDTVSFKGFLRDVTQAGISLLSANTLKRFSGVALRDQSGATQGPRIPIKPSNHGTFSGSFKLAEKAESGLYSVVMDAGEDSYKGELRVRDYVKPTFYLEISDKSGSLNAGQAFSFKLKATRFSGGVPQGARFEVFVYRKKYSVPEFVEEAGQGLDTGMNYYGASKGSSDVPTRLFSSVEGRQIQFDEDPWATAEEFASNGTASYAVTLPPLAEDKPNEEWIYTLVVRAKDSSGSFATVTEEQFVTRSEICVAAQVSKNVVKPKDTNLVLKLQTTYTDGRPAPQAKGLVEIKLQDPSGASKSLSDVPFETDGNGQVTVPIPVSEKSGQLELKALATSFEGKDLKFRPASERQVVIVAAGKGEAVLDSDVMQVMTNTPVIDSRGKAHLLVLLPKGWGNNEKGNVWLTQAADRIYNATSIPITGRSAWIDVTGKPEYGSGFFATLTAPMQGGKFSEAVMAIRQITTDKVLKIKLEPEKQIVAPFERQKVRVLVTNSEGKAEPDVEISLGVVDRALYQVQGEFRPKLMDFYFPLPKHNLMTFYSDDLQGFGYAAALGKPNFKLGALKSRSELAKKDMRDTAAWFPHLVTDANGQVTAEFDMPGNQTEWLITATAISKQSKVGEATSKFRSKSDVGVFPVMAEYFRQGDLIDVGLRISNGSNSEMIVAVSAATTLGSVKADALAAPIKIPAMKEVYIRAPFEAGSVTGKGQLSFSYQIGQKQSVVRSDFEILPASTRQLYSSEMAGEGQSQLATVLPDSGMPRGLKVMVSQGLLGAMLTASEGLLQYPYGCMEQLTHSTIPNLVLSDLLKKAGVTPDTAGFYGDLMKKAGEFANQGISRIVKSQHSDGGFGMWAGDVQSEVGMTAIVAGGLEMAATLGSQEAKAAMLRAINYLSGQLSGDPKTGLKLPHERYLTSGLLPILLDSPRAFGELAQSLILRNKEKSGLSLNELNTLLAIAEFGANAPAIKSAISPTSSTKSLADELNSRIISISDPTKGPVEQKESVLTDEGIGFTLNSRVEVSRSLQILHRMKALRPDVLKAGSRFIMSGFSDGGWQSTFDSAQIIFNLRSIVEEELKSRDKNARKIELSTKSGKRLGSLDVMPGGYFANFPLDGVALADAAVLMLKNLPENSFAQSTIDMDIPNEKLRAMGRGVKVTRQLYKIAGNQAVKIGADTKLHVGEFILSEVVAERFPVPGRSSSRYVVVIDSVPANAELVDNDREYLSDSKIKIVKNNYLSSVKETYRSGQKLTRVFEVRGASSGTSYAVWRVTSGGLAQLNAAEAFDMYDEGIRGNSDPGTFRVEN